ncbi:MAG: hypothetical protein ACREQ2_03235 [Candidatus Binatia bacterium]
MAWQSSKMPKKYQQQIILKACGEVDRRAHQIKQGQLIESNFFHSMAIPGDNLSKKKGRPDLAPLPIFTD